MKRMRRLWEILRLRFARASSLSQRRVEHGCNTHTKAMFFIFSVFPGPSHQREQSRLELQRRADRRARTVERGPWSADRGTRTVSHKTKHRLLPVCGQGASKR